MYRRILVPLDGSSVAESALTWAARLPTQAVVLLQVTPPLTEPTADDAVARAARDYLQRVVPPVADGRAWERSVARGDPAEEIVRAAREAELIVMTTRGRGAGGRLIYGSVADRVARHAPVPTLIVRGGDAPVAEAILSRVLVPLDGSATAARALPVAAALSRATGAPLHCVGVGEVEGIDDDLAPMLLSEGVYDTAVEAAHDRARRWLAAAADELRRDALPVSVEVRTGPARDEVLAAIRPGDLVVMTTHGAGAAQRWTVGAVAERVLHRAPAPVLLIRADVPARPPAAGEQSSSAR